MAAEASRVAAQSAARTPLVVGGVVLGAVVVLALHDPHVTGSYGGCPLHALTGLWCPACGGLRATHDLARGDLAGAWSMNPLWVLMAPVLVVLWGRWLLGAARGRAAPRFPAAAAWALLAVVLAFGVLRNVPALAPYLAP